MKLLHRYDINLHTALIQILIQVSELRIKISRAQPIRIRTIHHKFINIDAMSKCVPLHAHLNKYSDLYQNEPSLAALGVEIHHKTHFRTNDE